MRVFVAVDLSEEAKKETEKLLKVLEKKHWLVKWLVPKKLHQTLVFLGSVEKDKLPLVKIACKKAVKGIKAFQFSFKGLGIFPSYDWPRVIWLGLKGDLKSLARLQRQTEQELRKAGFIIKKQPFSPHITLGRIRKECHLKQRREIARQLKAKRELGLVSKILVDKILIFASQLSFKGSVYQKLDEINLPKLK